MNKFMKKLRKFEKGWKSAEADQEKRFSRVPDGKYRFETVGASIGESKKNARLQVEWQFRVIKGPQINKRVPQWDSLEDDRGWSVIKGRLAALGQRLPKRIVDLPEVLDNALETKFIGKVSTRKGGGDFSDLTIVRLLGTKKKKLKGKKSKKVNPEEGLDDSEE